MRGSFFKDGYFSYNNPTSRGYRRVILRGGDYSTIHLTTPYTDAQANSWKELDFKN